MKRTETRQFGLVCAMVCGLLVSGTSASVLYSTGFDPDEGYSRSAPAPIYDNISGQPVGAAIQWEDLGSWWGWASGWLLDDAGGYGLSDGAFGSSGYSAFKYSNTGGGNQVQFNTDSGVGNGTVWVEGYLQMNPTVQSSTSYIDFGLATPTGTSDPIVLVRLSDVDNSGLMNVTLVTSTDGAGGLDGQVVGTVSNVGDAHWLHAVLEVNYTTTTATVYGKMVTDGDTTALNVTDDLLGSRSFVPGANAFAGRAFWFGYKEAACFDELTVADNSLLIPEPATLLVLLGSCVLGLKRRRG